MSGLADRLVKLAEAQVAKIAHLRRPMTQNPTPKRMREYNGRVIDGDNLERGRQAMLALANVLYNGDQLPVALQANFPSTKDEIVRLVRYGTESNGYYDIHSTFKYADSSPAGLALQDLLERSLTQRSAAEQAEIEKQRKIDAMIDRLRFSNIDGFFPTPLDVAEAMAEWVPDCSKVLEPSAGIGSLADVLKRDGHEVHCIERMYPLRDVLAAKGYPLVGEDFLETEPSCHYDAVVMNPPYEKLQDADHIMHAWKFLRTGGRLIALMSPGAFHQETAKAKSFRAWFQAYGLSCEDLPDGAFDGPDAFRRTGVKVRLVTGTRGVV